MEVREEGMEVQEEVAFFMSGPLLSKKPGLSLGLVVLLFVTPVFIYKLTAFIFAI